MGPWSVLEMPDGTLGKAKARAAERGIPLKMAGKLNHLHRESVRRVARQQRFRSSAGTSTSMRFREYAVLAGKGLPGRRIKVGRK